MTQARRRPTAEREVTITRVFEAPRALVFRMWIEPVHMAQWWGPAGFTNPVCELDPRPGGRILIHMRAPDGMVHPMSGTFREIVAPERIVFSAVAEDHDGNPLLEARTVVTFSETAGRTSVTVHAEAVGIAPVAPRMLAGMEAGWTQSLVRLAALVADLDRQSRALRARSTTEDVMSGEPQAQHDWLQRLVGTWTSEMSCRMGPDQPPMTSTGIDRVETLGGLWVICSGEGTMPDGGPAHSRMTLGYDPARQRFVGTFVASMMTHLWIYDGVLDVAGKVLTLDTEGPCMTGDGRMVKYQDVITFVSDDHRTLTSRMLGDDGAWNEFMTAHYRRAG